MSPTFLEHLALRIGKPALFDKAILCDSLDPCCWRKLRRMCLRPAANSRRSAQKMTSSYLALSMGEGPLFGTENRRTRTHFCTTRSDKVARQEPLVVIRIYGSYDTAAAAGRKLRGLESFECHVYRLRSGARSMRRGWSEGNHKKER